MTPLSQYNRRIIARLDVKMDNLIKGIQMEGWRKVGDPIDKAELYYEQGVDEIIYVDAVASLYQRNGLTNIIRKVAGSVFVPITVGGGIGSVDAVRELLHVGADKVAINTAATQRPELLYEISDTYGSQATVLSIEAKNKNENKWEAMTDNGRNHTGLDVVEWAQQGQELGAGEIFITSIDRDGTKKGFDLKLLNEVANAVTIPVIASGGCGSYSDVADALIKSRASAVAIGRALHDNLIHIPNLIKFLNEKHVSVRDFRK